METANRDLAWKVKRQTKRDEEGKRDDRERETETERETELEEKERETETEGSNTSS
jgi:hypothetical protein